MLKNIRKRASRVIKKLSNDKYRSSKFLKHLGCSSDFLKNYIEARFTKGMTWDNYGQGKECWNIDHIKPISLMNTDCEKSIGEVCHYTNLQPLWFLDNIAKSNKYSDD